MMEHCFAIERYRRRALSTDPDKGGSPEAFRASVFAFETLIDQRCFATFEVKHRGQKISRYIQLLFD